MKKKLIEYIENDGITHSLDMGTTAREDFLTQFSDIILKPRNLDYKIMFPGPTGTNTVESALKIARKVTGRDTVVSFTNGFHGMSIGRSEEHTSELQSRGHLVCRLLLEK